MSDWASRMRSRLFAKTPRDRDAYHAEIERRLGEGMSVLDIGCGKGALNPFPWKRYPGVHLVGLDPDPEAASNPNLHEFKHMSENEPWSIGAESVDLVICRYVLEHVESPEIFMTEVRRVLKPGGRFVFLTPSRYYPVMAVSALLPHALHRRILARTKRSAGNDVFATFYRMNSKRALRRCARVHGFDIETLIQRDFQPADYFDFNSVLFSINLASFAIGKVLRLDRQIGASLLGVFRKA